MFGQDRSESGSYRGVAAMPFPDRLATLRKQRQLTQQALADQAGLHVSMIRKYETGAGQPNLEALRRLAVALSVPSDALVFDKDERGTDDEALRLQFEAAQRLTAEEKKILMVLIEGILLKHQHAESDKRLAATG